MRNPSIWTSLVFMAAMCGGFLLNACVTANGSEGEDTAGAAQQLRSCETCLGGQCETAHRNCFGDPACKETFTCARKCRSGDKQCVWDCILARPNTADTFFSAAWCGVKAPCKESCSLPEGIIDDCPVCSAKHCPQQLDTCFGNRECWDLVSCVRNNCKPGDLECAQECIAEYPGGLAEIQGLRECSSQHCVEACSGRTTYQD
jgi:hypothetical protein